MYVYTCSIYILYFIPFALHQLCASLVPMNWWKLCRKYHGIESPRITLNCHPAQALTKQLVMHISPVFLPAPWLPMRISPVCVVESADTIATLLEEDGVFESYRCMYVVLAILNRCIV